MSNAAKFSHKGDDIDVTISQNDAWATLTVKDYGVGMSEEVQKRIFEEGEIYTSKGTQSESGTGTGLQLLREYVNANAGELSYISHEGNGTSISVSFRRALI